MAFLYLAVAIVGEVAGTISLNLCENFSRLVPSILAVLGYVIAYAAFARLLQGGFPVGVAYAIWAAAGVAAVALIGAIFLHEGFSLTKAAGLVLVVSGVIVLELGKAH
jgi:small multidrug resistance pump